MTGIMNGDAIYVVLCSMILIISDDKGFADNLMEIANLEGSTNIACRSDATISKEDLKEGIELIIYSCSHDSTGEKFEWYLLANQLAEIPVIFLTLKKRKNDRANYMYLELPFEFDALESSISKYVSFPSTN